MIRVFHLRLPYYSSKDILVNENLDGTKILLIYINKHNMQTKTTYIFCTYNDIVVALSEYCNY